MPSLELALWLTMPSIELALWLTMPSIELTAQRPVSDIHREQVDEMTFH
jgi:hypothetical protein